MSISFRELCREEWAYISNRNLKRAVRFCNRRAEVYRKPMLDRLTFGSLEGGGGGWRGRRKAFFTLPRDPTSGSGFATAVCSNHFAVQDSGLMYEKGAPLRCTAAILQWDKDQFSCLIYITTTPTPEVRDQRFTKRRFHYDIPLVLTCADLRKIMPLTASQSFQNPPALFLSHPSRCRL